MNASLNTRPAARFPSVPSLLDRIFDDFARVPHGTSRSTRILPPVNLWADENAATAEFEVPGLAGDDLDIHVDGDQLTVKGEFKTSRPEAPASEHIERRTGAFTRTLRLPFEVQVDAVEASLEHGVLTVRLPRSAATQPRKIAIKAS